MPRGRNTTIGLSRDDIDALAAIAHFEARNQGRRGMQAVVDTVLNRVASPSYPSTIRGVVKEHRAFSALTGPARARPSITHGIADIDARLDALIDHTARNVRGIVNQHTAGRVNGVPSVIGRAVSYANPAHSDRVNREGWVNGIVERAAMGAPDHIQIGDHVFGVDPWHEPPPDYNITPDPQAQRVLAGIELPPGIPQARPHQATNPRARPSTMDVAPGFAAQAPKSAAFQFGPTAALGFGSPAQSAISQMSAPSQASQQRSGPMGLKDVQANLAGLGFNVGPIDGIMGPKTAAGIRGFQSQAGIDVDGKFGPQTQGALEQALASVPTPRSRPDMARSVATPAERIDRAAGFPSSSFASTTSPSQGLANQLGSNRSSKAAMEVGGYIGSPTADPSVMGTQPFDVAKAVMGGRHGGLFDAAPAQPADFGTRQAMSPADRIDQAFNVAQSPAASLGFAKELSARATPADMVGRTAQGPSLSGFRGVAEPEAMSVSSFDPGRALNATANSRIGQTFSDLGFGAPKADRLDMAPQMSPADRINQAHSTPVPSTPASPAQAPASFDPFSSTPTEMQSVMGQMPSAPADMTFGVPTVGAMAPGLATVQAPEKATPSLTPETIMDKAIPAAAVQQAVAPQAPAQAPAQIASPATPAQFDPHRSFATPSPMQTQRATPAQFNPSAASPGGWGSFGGFGGSTGIHAVDMGLAARNAALSSGMSSQQANYGAWDAFNSSPGAGYGPNVAQFSLAMARANGMGRGQNDAAGLSRDQAARGNLGFGGWDRDERGSRGTSSSGGMTGSGIGGGPASF